MQELSVEIWTDVVCSWCWIGLTRFDKAVAEFPHGDKLDVTFRSYRLLPGQPPIPMDEIMRERMGRNSEQIATMQAQVEASAAAEGLTYNLKGLITGDSIDAHRVVKLAETKGLGVPMLKRFYRAYLSEGRSVYDHDSLADLAAEVGLDREATRQMLAGHSYLREVEADHRAMGAVGGRGVPFFVIGGKYGIAGAQPVAAFTEVLTKAWAELPAEVETWAEGAVCGPDGCL